MAAEEATEDGHTKPPWVKMVKLALWLPLGAWKLLLAKGIFVSILSQGLIV